MFSTDTIRLYQRLFALGVLCACFAVFDFPALTRTTFAAGCIEECMDAEAQCTDSCVDECSSSSTACGSCIESCAATFNSCTFGKVICAGSGGGTTYSPSCQVYFGTHVSGNDQHEGYFQVCTSAVGNQQCIKCPPNEVCQGGGYSGGLGTCY